MLQLVIYPNNILRKVCYPIKNIKDNHIKIAKLMHAFLKYWGGVGLSAPQVKRPYRMFVINTLGFDKDNGRKITMINPEITWFSIEMEAKPEGCLSFGERAVIVKRPKELEIEYTDLDGNRHREFFKGLNARAIHHEFDHLEGILLIDY